MTGPSLALLLSDICANLHTDDSPFLLDRVSRRQLLATAAWLHERLPACGTSPPVCLAAEDKGVIAAAILASLAGGPVLLLPYAMSAQALAGLQMASGFALAITDQPRPLPQGIHTVQTPLQIDDAAILPVHQPDTDRELLWLYTGGSTGTPQLWPKTIANLCGEAAFLATHFQVGRNDRILATIAPYHIYGLLYSVLLPLLSGAAVHPATPGFPEEIIAAASEATIFISVPAHYRALRDKAPLGSSLRLAFSSAGMLASEDNRAFYQKNGTDLVEVYGSTETGGIALRCRARGEEHFTPYPTVQHRFSEGHLEVCSPHLSPNLPRTADGYFITADLAAPASGGFVLQGRADAITKVAGKRVDLEQIAMLIRKQPGVRDCAVLAAPEASSREHRIGALIEGETVDVEAIRQALGKELEAYAQPRVIKTVSHLPVKANGKNDREAILALLAQ